jgi:hypothetical protein
VIAVGIGKPAHAASADTKPPRPPKTKPVIYVLSPALPYILSFCLLDAGVYILDKAVLNFTYPFGDAFVRHLLMSEIGVEPTAMMDRKQMFLDTLGIVESSGFDDAELKMLFAANNLNNLPQVKSLLTARPPVWPVLLAGALFLYLWWLATLVFDLAFVWQRYVRGSVANDRLREWSGESHYNI